MHIKKLEICGFKSFVDKTVIHFDQDVIGIVGPNGCGKSNVVDAIRWCMGEQSAKHLRGRAMEDVIFNGSESRPQHGMAEVTLTFDNTDRAYAETLPLEFKDFPEIAVTRRLYRDGTSEYLVNKAQVRLRDITDLFLGTGVGTKAYSIVEQGRIGQIVSSRPADRRLYIEEAAGITKYKLRRKQAERKMELTKQNLLRVTDIVNEIDRTRAGLKRQAAKAERYVQYRAELEDLFLHDAAHRLLELIVTEKVHASLFSTAREQSLSLSEQMVSGEQSLLAARGEAQGIESRYDAATAGSVAAEQRLTQLQSEVARAEDRRTHLQERLVALGNEQQELSARLERLGTEEQELAQRMTWLQQDESSRDVEAQAEHQQRELLLADEAAADRELAEFRGQHTRLHSEAATIGARLESLGQRRADLEQRRQLIETERCQLGTELERKKLEEQALEVTLEQLEASRTACDEETEALKQRLAGLRPELKEQSRRIEGLKADLSHKRSRLQALADLHRRLEGVGAGTKALLGSDDPSVVGLLGDRVEVSERFTEAFAALLGDRLQCVIVKDPVRGLELLNELRQTRAGRATIAGQRLAYVAGSRTGAERDPLVIARLVDELHFNAEDEPLIRALVGDALVVATASDALALGARYAGCTVVALDGTVVREAGLVSGGSGDDMAAAMIEQKRELRALRDGMESWEQEVSSAVGQRAELETQIAELETLLELGRKTLHEREIAKLKAEKDLAGTRNEAKQAQARHSRLSDEGVDIESRIAAASAEQQAAAERAEQVTTECAAMEQALRAAEQKSAECKERTVAQTTRVTERRVRLAQVREQLDAARLSMSRIELETQAARTRLERVEHESVDSTEQLERTTQQWTDGQAACVSATEASQLAQRELDEVRQLLDQVRTGLSQHEGVLRQLRVDLAIVDDQSREAEMQVQKLQLERDHLNRNVAERFRGLQLPRVVGDYHARPAPDAEHRRRIDELSKLIDRMGPVNLDAKAEFDDAEKRFFDLSVQRDDIQQALDELDRAIRHMDRESKKRFKETFDAINELFQKTFGRLFKGGRGELVLTNPEDILETGVDIIAQPPGKKLGNIELMSGGEKALTATALIFAIFQYRPSPFCVLDEVDAPLDEANVSRYNEAIRSMTGISQFVLITHIKKTMQSVDVLYGVTMGEPGVSRVVSVKVNEAAKARSEQTGAVLESRPSASTAVA
jgi:chromosome segregation protein